MPKTRDPEPDEVEAAPDPEVERYRRRRVGAALRAGLTEPEAELFADSDTTMKTLRLCLTKGATPEEIAKIVV